VSFSRSGATSKNVSWLSLIIPNDANIIKNNLQEFKETNHIPQSLKENSQSSEYFQKRYDSSIKWIEDNKHAVISNGPFYLESYSPESRTIKVSAFEDDSYPFKKGEWSRFEKVKLPAIKKIDMKKIIQQGDELIVTMDTKNSDSILYFLTNSQGEKIISDTIDTKNGKTVIKITPEISNKLDIGANNIKIFAISNSVLKPDFYESSFITTNNKSELPITIHKNIEFTKNEPSYWIWIIPIIAIVGIIIFLKKRNQSRP
jgi:peptide/nickel transport system substrate-binding protein